MTRSPAARRVRRLLTLATVASLTALLPGSAAATTPRTAVAAIDRPAGSGPVTPSAFSAGAVDLTFTSVATGLSKPVLVTHAGDGSGRIFIVEQVGRIRVKAPGGALSTFLDIRSSVSKGSEQGLLGLAFHPNYESNGYFFVNYTNTAGDTIIKRYKVSSDPNKASTSGTKQILRVDQPYANHNGGHLAFGKDGYLYIGMGDGGSSGDPGNRAQNLNSLLGKMLRINVDSGSTSTRAYGIPSSNPYVGKTGRDEIWSRGLRNPWRWSFDRLTGDLWIGDVGQNRYEEVDRSKRLTSGAGKGANYGWRVMEGRHCYSPSSGCSTSGKVLPIVEYTHASGRCSVTGGYVYRGSASPVMAGGYFFADYCSGEIWAISAGASSPASRVLVHNTSYLISSFGEDEAGELYITDLAGGKVYRLKGT